MILYSTSLHDQQNEHKRSTLRVTCLRRISDLMVVLHITVAFMHCNSSKQNAVKTIIFVYCRYICCNHGSVYVRTSVDTTVIEYLYPILHSETVFLEIISTTILDCNCLENGYCIIN